MRRLTNPLTWSGHSVGMVAFLLLFPGFFFYHTALGLGRFGAFAGGYFAPVSLLVVGPLAFFYIYRIRRDAGRLGRADMLFLLWVGYFATVVAIQAGAGANPAIVVNHVLGILFILNMFFIFRLTDFSRRDVYTAGLLTLFGMSAIVFVYSVDGSFYLAPLGAAKNPESLATYQGFSRSYLVTFAAIVAFTRSRTLRMALYCIGAPTLFLNTARSEFVAMLFMMPIVELYYSRNKFLLASLMAVIFVVVCLYLQDILALLPSNRILELFDLSRSTSATKRHHLSVYALNTIGHFPIFGDYASYSPGFYSHNVLSAWVDTGLFGFLFVLALLILPATQMLLRGYFMPQQSGMLILAFSMTCMTLLLLASAHYFTDMMIGATLGSFSRYRYGRKNASHRTPDLGPPALRHPDLRQAVQQTGASRL